MALAAAAGNVRKFRYHHGQLRAALVDSALDILREEGLEALSLRALAKATGVTQAAPYSHFRDKEDLMAAVAETGFQRLALQMAEEAGGIKDMRARIKALMLGYIRFATDNKPLFQLMFSRELSDMRHHPTLAMTAGKGYALFSAVFADRRAEAPVMTVVVWSLCYGLATLILDGKITPAAFGAADLEALVDRAAGALAL